MENETLPAGDWYTRRLDRRLSRGIRLSAHYGAPELSTSGSDLQAYARPLPAIFQYQTLPAFQNSRGPLRQRGIALGAERSCLTNGGHVEFGNVIDAKSPLPRNPLT